MEQAEQAAVAAAERAKQAIADAIAAYEVAGFGSHVTQSLREARLGVAWSIDEVQS